MCWLPCWTGRFPPPMSSPRFSVPIVTRNRQAPARLRQWPDDLHPDTPKQAARGPARGGGGARPPPPKTQKGVWDKNPPPAVTQTPVRRDRSITDGHDTPLPRPQAEPPPRIMPGDPPLPRLRPDGRAGPQLPGHRHPRGPGGRDVLPGRGVQAPPPDRAGADRPHDGGRGDRNPAGVPLMDPWARDQEYVTEAGPEPGRGPLQGLRSPGPVREPGMAAPHVPGHTMTMAFTGRTNHVAVSCCCRPKGDHIEARPVLPAQEAYRLWLGHVKRAATGGTAGAGQAPRPAGHRETARRPGAPCPPRRRTTCGWSTSRGQRRGRRHEQHSLPAPPGQHAPPGLARPRRLPRRGPRAVFPWGRQIGGA